MASARNRGGAYYGHYAYDENGRRLQRTLGNGTVNSYEYDDNDRLKQLSITHDGEVLASFRYSHDGAGNRTGIEYGDGSRSVYEYDEAYRLIRDLRVDARGGTLYDESYAYDAVGNRLRKTRLGGRKPVDVAYAYNARNQLVSATGDEAGEYEYDRDGNLIRTAGPHGVETREYDVLGRLTGYAGPGGTERYTHIGADWKRQTAIYTPNDGEEEKYTFLYDGDNVLMDLVGDSHTLKNTYVTPYLDESLVMIRAGEGADHYYMSHDGLGSVRTLTNHNGVLRNSYDYTAYGEADPVSTFNGPVATHQRYGFTGRENNPVAGDMFYRNRSFDYGVGRFESRDPIGYEGDESLNIYNYSGSSPITYEDQDGLKRRRKLTRVRKKRRGPTPWRGQNWEGGIQSSIDCLSEMCDQLPSRNDAECGDDNREDCIEIAKKIVQSYTARIEGLRQYSFCAKRGLTGIDGNFCDYIYEYPRGIGCINTANVKIEGLNPITAASSFDAAKEFSSRLRPIPHWFVVISHPKSTKKCVSTAWETGTPSMEDYNTYPYTKPEPDIPVRNRRTQTL